MLSRHFLRCKVLQVAYAYRLDLNDNASDAVRTLEYNIGKLNELGVLQVSMLTKMVEVAAKVMEEGKQKFRPTEEELNPNTKLLGNEFLRRLADNFEFKKHVADWCGCWDTHENLIREAFLDFKKQKVYLDYLAKESSSYEEDKELAIMMFRYLVNRDSLVAVMGERSLLWEDDFHQIAQYNYMMLKTLNEADFDEAMLWPLMYDQRVEKEQEDIDFAKSLIRHTLEGRVESEELIKRYLRGWEFERVSLMDILLIDMAVAELTKCPSIPERVTVDEYIELSKEYSSERSKLFINGILDKLVSELRSQGKINKWGRGISEEEN